MEDMEWKGLANDAAKLYMGTEKDGIGKFMYRLRPEVPYAQLSTERHDELDEMPQKTLYI